jgi:glyoxylase-like metal-dependent hydrolase (beta-lactamase superfamily II)
MAEAHVLVDGYARDDDRVGSSIGFAREGDVRVVIDPGLVSRRSAILDPLAALGGAADDVTDVVISHHHPITRSTWRCSRTHACTITGPGTRTTCG